MDSSFALSSANDEYTPSRACMQIFADFYEANWTVPFEDGPQKVALLDSNCECNAEPLCVYLFGSDADSKTFQSWSDFADWLNDFSNHGNHFGEAFENNFSGEPFVNNFKDAKARFIYIIDPENHLDAHLFVTVSSLQKNPLARWISSFHSHHFATNLIKPYYTINNDDE